MFWINNPTRKEADLALDHGALGCTNNPSYTQKMLEHPEEGAYTQQILANVLRDVADDRQAAIEFQARLVEPITKKFMPLYEQSGGEHGGSLRTDECQISCLPNTAKSPLFLIHC